MQNFVWSHIICSLNCKLTVIDARSTSMVKPDAIRRVVKVHTLLLLPYQMELPTYCNLLPGTSTAVYKKPLSNLVSLSVTAIWTSCWIEGYGKSASQTSLVQDCENTIWTVWRSETELRTSLRLTARICHCAPKYMSHISLCAWLRTYPRDWSQKCARNVKSWWLE